ATIMSSTFLLEWPPRSGNWSQVPEIDKAQWFTIEEALLKINPAQCVFLERLMLSSFLP
ncbi:MAG: hypothetical protein H7Y03_07270, partial [Chitinophagaceae bacterium]|nr:hypothetical protein [Chitinophagaceae bacterium]